MESQAAVHADVGATSPDIRIREAEIGDARPLAVLMTQLEYPTTEDEMAVRLSAPGGILARRDYLVAVAVCQEQVVGVIGAFVGLCLEMDGRYGRVIALSVAEDHRAQSIGSLLLAHAEAWLRARGASACIVNNSTHRTGAHRFYARGGYQMTGLRYRKDLRRP